MAHEYKAEMKPLEHNLKCLNCVSNTYVCVSDGETLHLKCSFVELGFLLTNCNQGSNEKYPYKVTCRLVVVMQD